MSEPPPLGVNGWRTIGVTAAASFMVSMELTVISLAFPQIRARFPDASEELLSWVFSGYSIGVASLLLIGGWLAGNYDNKRVFLGGLAVFLAGSILAGAAQSAEMLIAARVVQSVGGAFQFPSGLALLLTAVPPARHQMAIGIWGAAGALAAALGPTLGALLVDGFGWRAVFLINVPVIGLGTVLALAWLPTDEPSGDSGRVDLVGVPLAGVGVGAMVLGIVQGNAWGWGSTRVVVSFMAAAGLISLFIVRSLRHPRPLFDLSLFRLRSYATANIATMLFGIAFFGWLVPLPTLLQDLWGWSVLETGFAIAPGPFLAFLIAPQAGRLADRTGNRPILTVCGISGAVGMLLQSRNFGVEPQYVSDVLLPGLFFGIAAGTGFPQLVGATMRDVPARQYAMAGAGRTTVFQVSIALAIAIAVAVIGRPSGTGATLEAYDTQWFICGTAYALLSIVIFFGYPTQVRSS